jgi:hypothetical protein
VFDDPQVPGGCCESHEHHQNHEKRFHLGQVTSFELKVPSLTSRLTKVFVKDLRPVATTTVFVSQAKLRLPAGKKILYRWSRVV